MLKYCKWLSGLALASLFLVADLPGVCLPIAAQALTVRTVSKTKPTPQKIIARNQRSGRIKVVYGKTKDRNSNELMQAYRQYKFFETFADIVTSEINLPRDLTIVVKDCNMANSFYRAQEHKIFMCNELVKENYQLLIKKGHTEEKAMKGALLASVFYFYHEFGHAIIHELDLPIVGQEEDIADRFAATFLLINDSSETKSISGEILMAAAKLFKLESTTPKHRDFQDEHALSQQRFYNIVCMLYGAAPDRYRKLVVKLNYEETRLERCQMESGSIFNGWKRLLQPYLKT
jgi:Putative metallopeptidase